jgi:hypothetical protein
MRIPAASAVAISALLAVSTIFSPACLGRNKKPVDKAALHAAACQ